MLKWVPFSSPDGPCLLYDFTFGNWHQLGPGSILHGSTGWLSNPPKALCPTAHQSKEEEEKLEEFEYA